MVAYTLALALIAAPVQTGSDATDVVEQARVAVEGDSVARVERGWERALGRDSTDRLARLGLATVARLTYRDSVAERSYRSLLGASENERDGVYVHAALGLALVLRGRSEWSRADSLADLAVSAGRATGDGGLTAEALARLATVRHRTDGAASALTLLEEAEAVVPAGDERVAALIHCARSRALSDLRDPSALEEARTGARLAERAGDLGLSASCVTIEAIEHTLLGDSDSALAAYGEAAARFRRARDRGGLAAALQWRSHLLSMTGLLGAARRDGEEAIREARLSGRDDLIPWAMSTLANVAFQVGDIGTAVPYASEVTSLFTARGDRFATASAAFSEASIDHVVGDLDAARSRYEAVIRETREIGWPAMEVPARERLMHVAVEEGDLARGRHEWRQAMDLAMEAGLAGRAGALSYHGAVLNLLAGEVEEAERLLRAQLLRMDVQPNWRYLTGARLAEALVRRGRVEEAEREMRSASRSFDEWRAQLEDRDLRLMAFQLAEDWPDPDLGVATVIAALAREGRVASAFELTERGRARDFADRLTRAAALDISGAAGARRERAPVTLDSLMRAVPDDSTAVLEYVSGRGDPTTLFVITRQSAGAHILQPQDSLARPIARLTALLESGGDALPLARLLGAALLGPALPQLNPAIKRLIVVPDGPLHRLPFDVLVLPDGAFVLERFAVTYAPSASVFVQLRNRRTASPPVGLVALADPRFDNGVGEAAGDDPTLRIGSGGEPALPRLAGAAREAAAVARYSDHASVLRRGEASEAWLKAAALEGYGVIHFATHAIVDEGSIAKTALALTAGGDEDGFVGPGELATLVLEAELVVLSACRTAGGVLVRGEGMQGLTAPLLGAGARAVAATWWPIGDAATIRLMDDFYRAMAAGLPAADALRSAKLAALRRGVPPREWTAFALFGDPLARPVLRPVPRGRGLVAWAGGGAGMVLLLAGAYGLLMRRGRRGEGRIPSSAATRTHHR